MADAARVIGRSSALEDAGPGLRFTVLRGGEVVPAFAVRFRGRVHAYVNECRHQSSELDWEHGEFFDPGKLYLVCASHGALYEPDTGLCVAGPCRGKKLAMIAVDERDGNVLCAGE
jgi:nitrite reductase/ring-hydroxylating ferredoxin subunit